MFLLETSLQDLFYIYTTRVLLLLLLFLLHLYFNVLFSKLQFHPHLLVGVKDKKFQMTSLKFQPSNNFNLTGILIIQTLPGCLVFMPKADKIYNVIQIEFH